MRMVVAENPLRIRQWSEGFQPISVELVACLRRFLSDPKRPDTSVNAVNMLVHYASDDVPLLASLLPEARPSELTAITEAIALHGDAGIDAVVGEWDKEYADAAPDIDLQRPWGSPWWCAGERKPLQTDPGGEPLSPSIRRQLQACQSVIAEHAVMAHKVPRESLEQLDRKLSIAGYRIASISFYETDEDENCAVLWLRDGATSRFAVDETADALAAINEENRSAGFLPDALTAFRRRGSEQPSYSLIWIKAPGANSGLVDADVYLDLHQDMHESEGWRPMSERGLGLPRSNLLVRKDDGTDYFSSVRWRTEKEIGYHDAWNMDWDENSAVRRHSRSLVGLQNHSSLVPNDASPGATAIWWSDLPIDSRYLEYQAGEDHLLLAQQQISDGFYPVSIDAASVEKNSVPQFCSTWWRGAEEVDEKIARSKRVTNLAVSLFRLGQHDPAQGCLEELQQAAVRGAMIAAFAANDLDPAWLVRQMAYSGASPELRRSSAMALALYPADALSQRVQNELRVQLPSLYASAADPGLRSAVELIATKAKVQLPETGEIPGEVRSPLGDRLVIIDPKNPVWLGSPAGEPGRDQAKEPLHPVNLLGKYAVATREVTVAQFLEFRRDHGYTKYYAQTDDCPIINVSWFDAAKYCRWLSEKELLPESEMCYPKQEEIKPGMHLEADFAKRTGYRLPTEAEWEFACRGGVSATRWFGFDPDRLPEHAWTTQNSDYLLQPVGRLLPNDLGLFDMLGNAMEWCHSSFTSYPTHLTEPIVDPGLMTRRIDETTLMVNRGGANLYQPLDARASQRNRHEAKEGRVYITFRIARTIKPEE